MPKAKPTKKTPVKAAVKKIAKETSFDLPKKTSSEISGIPALFKKYQSSKKLYVIIALLVIITITFYEKKWIVAATVNGSPVPYFEVLRRMNSQYKDQTLTQIVNEKLVFEEARKKGVIVKNSDIDAKIVEIEKNLGGAQVLDSMLAQQGQTRETLRDQVKIQLIIERMYSSEATVSAQEVADFITQNKDQLTSTDSAKQSQEATDAIKQQKLSQIFSQKFQELKTAAKIKIF